METLLLILGCLVICFLGGSLGFWIDRVLGEYIKPRYSTSKMWFYGALLVIPALIGLSVVTLILLAPPPIVTFLVGIPLAHLGVILGISLYAHLMPQEDLLAKGHRKDRNW